MNRNKIKTKPEKLLKLFLSTLYISAFTFGGGFVIITFMKRKFVDNLHWIDEDEMLDMAALAQSSPGAIAVNAAILIGWKTAGLAGMLVAVAGTIMPPMAIIGVLYLFYEAFEANAYVQYALRGMQAGVAAVILDVVCDMGLEVAGKRSVLSWTVMLASFVAVFFFKINVVYIILTATLLGAARAFVEKRRHE